jgi:1,4-alpha-glucan branching enzyme
LDSRLRDAHVGFQVGGQWESIYFMDRAAGTNPNDSQFFTDQTHIGPIYALWKREVRSFLIDNADFFLREYHADGFRHDRVDVIMAQNWPSGLTYCQDLTATAHTLSPAAIQIAEHWPADPWLTQPAGTGAPGFDAVWHDSLRDAIRAAIEAASWGSDTLINLGWVADALNPVQNRGFSDAWRVVTCVENHDIVYQDKGSRARIPALAAGDASRTWYGCSRARVASSILLTAPGIPLVFMGQEFAEDRPWGDNPPWDPLIRWEWLDGGDKIMGDHLRFFQELVWLRRRHPALRSPRINVFQVDLLNRVIAFHRWCDGAGRDVVVIASLREQTLYGYQLGLPRGGTWLETFNTDIYQSWVNPLAAGNGGTVWATGEAMHGFTQSATLTIPANAVLVLTLDRGD